MPRRAQLNAARNVLICGHSVAESSWKPDSQSWLLQETFQSQSEGKTVTRIASTIEVPYYAVVFTSERTEGDNGYEEMARRMVALAAQQPGFLGVESAREELGITVSYWTDPEAIKNWKANLEHQEAQRLGHSRWYTAFKVRIAKVERDYAF